MEMQQVRYFLSVARTLNFTRAAEECNVTQPALTRAIKQLEDELGGELIRREGRLSHLTDLGNRMQPLLMQCFDAALAAKLIAAKVKKGEVPSLSLAVSRTLDLEHLMRPLTEMHRSFAGLQLKLRRGTGAQIAAMLKNGEVDLAIGGPMGESWDRLESWPMFSEAFDLVVGADHPLAMHNDLDLDVELIRDVRFLVHADTDMAEFEAGCLDATGICLDHAHEVDSDRDLEALVVAEFGVAIMPASAMNSARVRHLTCSALDLKRTVAIYSVAGRARSREASALLNLVRSADWSRRLAVEALEDA
ncbi:LysR family transcriptional regulator [Sphingomonas sp. SUN039]|uniref:LysR family transcriptional regulator n=1 Tax=Sphingomonas sp. SUN039 TaxID=2937787 RepID=UPI002164C44A|nr:LysR family transcriptional regulator [Sphingomonas sp. SUN039]UVO55308.1 LysR family transcriptional regulator [Sphingomonas sp. SUN039]